MNGEDEISAQRNALLSVMCTMEERWRREQHQEKEQKGKKEDDVIADSEDVGLSSPSHPRSRANPIAYGCGETLIVFSTSAEMPIENVQVCRKRGQDFKTQIYLRMKTKNITTENIREEVSGSGNSTFVDQRPDFGRFAVLGVEVDARFLFPQSTIKFRTSDLEVVVPCVDPNYNTGSGSKVFAADEDQRVFFVGRGHPNALQIDHGLLRQRRKSAHAYGLRCLMLPGVPPPALMEIFTEDLHPLGKAGFEEESTSVPALQSRGGRNAASQRGEKGAPGVEKEKAVLNVNLNFPIYTARRRPVEPISQKRARKGRSTIRRAK